MKKLFLPLLLALFILSDLKADNPPVIGSISGSVIDAATKEPLPYVNVVVRNNRDSIITGGITDAKGNFQIREVPGGSQKVEIQFIGYEKVTKDVELSVEKSRMNLSTIALSESSLALEGAEVRAEISSVVQKIDRKVINVGKDLTATGTTASELLNNVQSVSVDPESGNISLRGNENVKILVDGRPTNVSAAQLMKQIPSSSIKSIELITNPSAKYSPEGMSGIINIVLYKNATLGLNGNINGGLSYSKNLKYNGALDLNYRKGKVNLFANYGGNGGDSQGGGNVWREDNNSHQVFTNQGNNASHLFKVGADIYLNDKNTLGFYTTQNLYKGMDQNLIGIFFEDILDSENTKQIHKENYSGTYNINFSHDFDKKGHNIEFEASTSLTDKAEDGAYGQLMNPVDLTSNYVDATADDIMSSIVNLDYTNPLTENIKLELGLEARFRTVENSYLTDRHSFLYDGNNMMVPDGNGWYLSSPMGNSSFNYNRSIYSAYANYGQQFGKLSMQLGVRVEQYDVTAVFQQSEESQDYLDKKLTAYPSAFFTYSPTELNQFQLSYSRRVDRPGVNQINPIRSNWSSPLVIFAGNPALTPQFTNSYEFNYTRKLKKGSATAGVFYRYINDNISRYAIPDPLETDKVLITWVNNEGQERYGFELSGMYRLAKWWNFNASSDVYYQLMSGYAFNEYVEVESWATNVRMNNTFNVTENLSFQLFAMYRGARQIIQWEFQPMWMVNSGLSYKVFNKKGTVSLRVNDIFGSMQFRFESINYYPSRGGFFWESRSVYLGYSHNFGQGDFKARKRRSRGNDEMSGGSGF